MCGIAGIISREESIVPSLLQILENMQHRGQESAGIAVSSPPPKSKVFIERGRGEVWQAFFGKNMGLMRGYGGIGQVRYSTLGSRTLENAQPLKGYFKNKFPFAIVHQGNLINLASLRRLTGVGAADVSDTYLIARLIECCPLSNFEDALLATAKALQGAFNIIALFDGKLYIVKDPWGFHPLQISINESTVSVASESCAFAPSGQEALYDIVPGTFTLIAPENNYFYHWEKEDPHVDLFEFIYFLLPPSLVHGVEAGTARYWMGKFLSAVYKGPDDTDTVVVPVADSGNQAALGFWEGLEERGWRASFRPWALFRSHSSNVRRTFIDPEPAERERKLRRKFNARPAELAGKTVILVDDSIVRGTTARFLVQILKEAGVRRVFGAIPSPMYLNPCLYGTNTFHKGERLIARDHRGDLAKIREEIGFDDLQYLELSSTIAAVQKAGEETRKKFFRIPSGFISLRIHNFYTGPFSGDYPAGRGDFSSFPILSLPR
jgi:amidophosphoribosyltransferase